MKAAAFLFALAAGAAQASIEAGQWEFSLESPLQGTDPAVRQRCLSAEEAADPAKVLEEVRAKNDCQLSNLRDDGAEYKFDLECSGRTPVRGSGSVRYTPGTLDGEIDLVAERQGLRLKTRSFVSGRRLGPCNK